MNVDCDCDCKTVMKVYLVCVREDSAKDFPSFLYMVSTPHNLLVILQPTAPNALDVD